MSFDINFDLTRKAQLAFGGNMTGSSDKDPYYGVENNNNVLVLIFLGNINNLEESETHFGNAYPHNFTKVL